ncbi:cellulose synthase/poly-beta-1,6-N-acetylglucosamine synthase-like glycosyltransferase [Mucilaginibacter yixingensis]|uniref:Cellulose synthase/poly-beta-1,6-N-acetylglucosamine synthase-like glycosyltransferase n=1 Tax=Mucilaginibacter yixingensis TaxID=1295612 RepID=A0A2T5J852_9SPHI|nr:glycosyltransferase [Mucilaginibacter yixingensis]PTQ95635.1 cellulose synthase/poly-beta-1,6-N-acetylglucosamine synthase-like glycosyltransferase [Mucilaginibacter yixingensis]
MAHKQVFQADNPGRWNRFKWLSRIIILVLIGSVIGAIITIRSTQYPELPNLNAAPKKFSKEDLEYLRSTRKYKAFKIDTERLVEMRRNLQLHRQKHPNNKARINVGFYRAWETQAYTSLQDHISRLDMIVSEGFTVTPNADTLTVRIDTGLVNLNRRYNKPILISLSNYINIDNKTGGFDSKDVVRIVNSKKSRTTFINSIVSKLVKYNMQGVNLELEDLKDRNTPGFIAFEKELYETLHAQKFLVTQNVAADDEAYNLEMLQHYNDYLFVFAVDQHGENTTPGDVAHQHWVEEILDNVCSRIPSNKVILTIAGGGYDWPENSEGRAVGYQEAVSTAKENNSQIVFDPQSANLHYNYIAQDGIKHTVYFVDAVANFNIIRMADDWATGGVALWRIGVEDPRLWSFFQKNLAIDILRKTGIDTAQLTRVGLNNHIDYAGDGEVLDLVTTPDTGKISIKIDHNNFMITDQKYIKLPTKYVIRKYGYAPKKVVLTFDDGPDPDYTPRILDILKREHVPAAFFVVGSMVEKNIPLLRREFDEGYEIGNHTYFHPDISTIDTQRVKLELNATRKLIESVTGRSTILFRPPFNADAEPQTLAEVIPVAQSKRQSYINIGESIDPWDWQPGVTADSIIARVKRDYNKGSMILLHDAGGDTREETVKALPEIIHFFKSKGYTFTTIADVLGKKKEDLMPPIHDDANSGITGRLYDIFIGGYFYGSWILEYIFVTAIFLAIARIIFVGVLALKQYSDTKKEERNLPPASELPPVSIIVPGYNEEVTALKTINSLLETEYSVYEIIFVDDGSKDKTFEIVNNAYGDHESVRVLTKPNGGKASALNFGISHAKYDFVVCIDADTQLSNDAIYHLMAYFTDEEIGAVAGTVKVGNANNLITHWQSIEYITAQNMDRRAFDVLNSITVVPGAIGAFRKSAIFKAGGFTMDTLAEDCDLTMRILKLGYIVRNCDTAFAYTEAPETLEALMKQRFRWSFGVIQSFWKNRDALFNKKYKYFGMVGMPNILLFQIILPLFSPLADIMMVFGLFSDKPGKILIYYLAFIVVDLLVSVLAFRMEKEDYKKLVYIIPQKFAWRQLMYYILFKSVRRALKGQHSGWGVLKRTGNVKLKEAGKK